VATGEFLFALLLLLLLVLMLIIEKREAWGMGQGMEQGAWRTVDGDS